MTGGVPRALASSRTRDTVTAGSSYIQRPRGVQATTPAIHHVPTSQRRIMRPRPKGLRMVRPRPPLAVALAGLLATAACGSGEPATTAPPEGTVPLGLQEVASGLGFPVYLTAPPGEASRLLIVAGDG